MTNRVILVEFVIVDRFHCGIQIPYINGFLKKRGVSTIYVHSGLLAQTALNNKNAVSIDEESYINILSYIKDYEPDRIIFSHKPDDKLIRDISRYVSNIYWVETFDKTQPNILEFYKSYNIDEKTLFQNIPDFGFINVNKKAEEFRPLPHLVLFNECNYRKSLKDNQWYKDISIPSNIKKCGCTFCVNPDVYQEGHFDKKRVVDQIKSAIETTPWGRFRKRVRIIGEIIVHNLDRFFDIIVREGIDETDFLFNFRVDNFIKNTDRIERALKIISETRNRFFLALVGIENFSNIELERYNKGFKNYDIFKFLSIVFELKHKYQNHFDYQEYGGFSLILFNPFTRVEDLRLNYHLIKYLGIENVCGKLFTSRLRLYEELPLYYLVRNEGLIVDKYKRKNYYTARYNFYKEEVPWRYKSRSVEKVNRYLIKDDSINLDKVIRYLEGFSKMRSLRQESDFSYISQIKPDMFYKIEAEFMKRYRLRRIGKAEFNDDIAFERHLNYVKRYHKYYLITSGKFNNVQNKNIFYSNNFNINSVDPRIFEECQSNNKYYHKIAKLLGYPHCCSNYYHREMYYLFDNYLFLLLLLRYRSSIISKNLTPFSDHFFFIPCSLSCKKAEEFVIIRNNITKRLTGYDALKYTDLPIVFLLPFDPNLSDFKDNLGYVIVEPLSDVDDEFSYKPILYSGNDKRLKYILASDKLVMKDGFMELYKGRRHIHTFCAEANVWYYKKPLDYKFWREFSEAYYKSVIYNRKFGKKSDVFVSQYSDLYEKIETRHAVFNRYGYKIVDKSVERNVVILYLAKDGKSIEIRIQNLKNSDKYFKKGRKYSVSIGRSDDNATLAEEAANLVLRVIEDER